MLEPSGPDALRPVPFLDVAAMHASLLDELDAAWRAVRDDRAFIGGPYVATFEQQWADYCGVAHCIGVGNGTDAISAALRGLGVGRGDEVIVPANTYIASATAVTAIGAVPVFCDVDPHTLLITADEVRQRLTNRTAAVIVVHLYGQMADLDAIGAVAVRAGIAVVEDAAQAHGATWRGRRPGAHGHVATYSFYPGKNLGALGDGGAVVTDDAEVARRVRLLTNHGRSPADRFTHLVDGCNSRLDGLQAALLSVKLPYLDAWNAGRRAVAAHYRRVLGSLPVGLVDQHDGSIGVHHVFPILVEKRDAVASALAEAGVETNCHYPIPCHRQPAFDALTSTPLPVAERAAAMELSLPMYPHLDLRVADRVCDALGRALDSVGSAP